VRDTEDDAWAAAEDLLSQAAAQVKAQRRAVMVGTPMVGQQAQAQVVADHRLDRHLWNGISTVRVNCGSALVGTPEQIAHELLAYWRLGIDEFILSGYPHLEECHRAADALIPLAEALMERERHAA
jgi:alkanesulfonate monooxygenase